MNRKIINLQHLRVRGVGIPHSLIRTQEFRLRTFEWTQIKSDLIKIIYVIPKSNLLLQEAMMLKNYYCFGACFDQRIWDYRFFL